MSLVLDTCALIWWSLDPENLSSSAQKACEDMEEENNGLVASISIWEVAIKIKNKKLNLGVPLDIYVERLQQSDVISIIPIDENLWLKSVNLDWFQVGWTTQERVRGISVHIRIKNHKIYIEEDWTEEGIATEL